MSRSDGYGGTGGGRGHLGQRLATKLAGGFAGVLLCTVLVAAVGMSSESQGARNVQELAQAQNVAYMTAEDNSVLNDIQAHVFHYVISPNATTLKNTQALTQTLAADVKTVDAAGTRGTQAPALGSIASSYLTDVTQTLQAVQGGHTGLVHADFARVATQKDAVTAILRKTKSAAEARSADIRKAAAAAEHTGFMETILLSLLALAAAVALSIGLIRSVSRPVVALSVAARAVADGDLSLDDLPAKGKDEVAHLTHSFNAMVGALRDVIGRVRDTSQQVAAASEQLTASADQNSLVVQQVAQTVTQVAEGAGVQSRSVGDASHAVGELKTGIDLVASGAQQQTERVERAARTLAEVSRSIDGMAQVAHDVSAAATQTLASAQHGGEAIEKTVAGMERIQNTVFQAAQKVQDLGSRTQQIGEIVAAIAEIADQTNLLALNAAIEAARAGEHGKGFAVVADAVRQLAERSSTATKEIASLITGIREGTEAVVAAMQDGTSEVEAGGELAAQAGRALHEILGAMERTNAQVQTISASAQEVAASSGAVVSAMDEVNHVTQESTSAAQQMAASSEQVNGAIQQVTVVSQQTAAASQQVSASAQEMSAATEQIAGSARSLAEMAQSLQSAVARFRLRATAA